MFEAIYQAVATYSVIVAGALMVFMTILTPIGTKIVQYINDGEFAHVPKWWVPMSRFVFPYKWGDCPDLNYGVNESYHSDDRPDGWDGEEMFVSMLNMLTWILLCLGWPLVGVVLTVWGFLYLLRAVTRLTKKVVKLARFAHKHPSDVAHTMVEGD